MVWAALASPPDGGAPRHVEGAAAWRYIGMAAAARLLRGHSRAGTRNDRLGRELANGTQHMPNPRLHARVYTGEWTHFGERRHPEEFASHWTAGLRGM